MNTALAEALIATGGGGGPGPPNTTWSKRDIVEHLLTRGAVLIHCDGRSCFLPGPLDERPHVILKWGWGLKPPIYDMQVGTDALTGALTFGRQMFRCVIPWSAIFAANVEGEAAHISWPEDYPSSGKEPAARPVIAEREEVTPPTLHLVPGEFDPLLESAPRGQLYLVTD